MFWRRFVWFLSFFLLELGGVVFLPLGVVAAEPLNGFGVVTNLPYNIAGHVSFTKDNRIFAIVGSASTYNSHDDIVYSDSSSGGVLGSWGYFTVKYPKPMIWPAIAKYGNRVYVLGGFEEYSASSHFSDNYVNLTDISSGDLTTWTGVNSLPVRLSQGAAVAANGYVYFSGGFTDTESVGSASSKVYYAQILGDGTLGAWGETTPIPSGPTWGHGMVEYNGAVYLVGGIDGDGDSNKVYKAIINSDGTLGSWMAQTSLTIPSRRGNVIRVGDYILVIGGYENGTFHKENYYTQINSSGNITSWTKSGFDYPYGYCCGAVVEAGGYLYVIGGYLSPDGYTNKVYKSQLNIVLPTPTPTVPVVLIPGMGASWNYEAMVHSRTDVPDSEWKIAPFVTLYNGLINALGSKAAVYPYDWRRNITDTAANLASFIDSKTAGKVDLVGHSMGGLVARAYAQSHPDRIDDLVTVGSPYEGSVNVYRIWEGGDFSDMPYWMSLSSKLLLRVNRGSYANEVAEVQTLFPSLRNIWPTFDFTNRPRSWSNNFLPLTYSDKLVTIQGSGFDTLKYLKVVSRTAAEAALNKWVDGKPVENQFADGDNTVLKNGADVVVGGANHGQLIGETAGQQAIIDSLGVVATPQVSSQSNLENAVLVAAASPVNISVTDSGGNSYTSQDGLVVINNPGNGTFTVDVDAAGSGGNYDVYFGKVSGNDEAWETVSGNVGSGESDQYQFNVNLASDNLGSDPINTATGRLNSAITDVKSSSLGKISKNLLLQELARIKSYVADIDRPVINSVAAFDSRMLRLVKTVESLVKRLDSVLWSGLTTEQKTQLKEYLRLVVADVEQAREDKFEN